MAKVTLRVPVAATPGGGRSPALAPLVSGRQRQTSAANFEGELQKQREAAIGSAANYTFARLGRLECRQPSSDNIRRLVQSTCSARQHFREKAKTSAKGEVVFMFLSFVARLRNALQCAPKFARGSVPQILHRYRSTY